MPLSTKQMEYLALAWQCFESEPKIDYNKFYQIAGLKTAHSARELMRVTKNKLKAEYGALSGTVQAANSTGGTPKKNRSTASASVSPASSMGKKRGRQEKDTATGDAAVESPTKKARNSTESNGDGGEGMVMAEQNEEDELI